MDGYHRGMEEFRTNVLNRVEGKKVIAMANTPDNTRSAFFVLLPVSFSAVSRFYRVGWYRGPAVYANRLDCVDEKSLLRREQPRSAQGLLVTRIQVLLTTQEIHKLLLHRFIMQGGMLF